MSWVENRKDKLVLAAKLYPHPTPQDVLWNITTATGFVVTLKPGEKESDFSAEIIEKDTDHAGIYKFTLTIANISDENIPASVSISLKSLSETRVETFQLMPEVGHRAQTEEVNYTVFSQCVLVVVSHPS